MRDQAQLWAATVECICVGETGVRTPRDLPLGTLKDVEEWRRFLNRWQIGGPIPVEFAVTYQPRPDGLVLIYIAMRSMVPDAYDPEPPAAGPPVRARPSPADVGTSLVTEFVTYVRPRPVKPREFAVDIMAPTPEPVDGATDRWLRALARWWYLHELDERIMLDGKRKYDPHNTRNPTPEDCSP